MLRRRIIARRLLVRCTLYARTCSCTMCASTPSHPASSSARRTPARARSTHRRVASASSSGESRSSIGGTGTRTISASSSSDCHAWNHQRIGLDRRELSSICMVSVRRSCMLLRTYSWPPYSMLVPASPSGRCGSARAGRNETPPWRRPKMRRSQRQRGRPMDRRTAARGRCCGDVGTRTWRTIERVIFEKV